MFNSTQMISSCTVNKNNETAATFYIKFIQSCLCVFKNSVFLLTDDDCCTTQTATSVWIHYTAASFHNIFPSFSFLQVQCCVKEKLEGISQSNWTKYAFNWITVSDRYTVKCYEKKEKKDGY